MKKISALLAFFAALTLISACNKDIETVQEPAKEMTISVSIPDDGLTKVALEQDATDPNGVIKLAWEAEDLITVKNAADDSKAVVFSLKDGAGTKSATFTATDASALDGATAFDIYLTSNLPDDCSEQTQAANGSTSHLGYYATLRGVNKFDGVTFSHAWATANGEGTFASSAYLRIRAKMPSAAIAAAVQKVTLKASAEILAGSNEMEITITKPGSDDDIVTVYATLTPESVAVAEGTGLMVQFQVSSDPADMYTAFRELSAKTFAAGKVNAMNINCVNVDKFANDTEVNIGTSANPYLIGDRHQMVAMHDLVELGKTKYFTMIDDVDLKGVAWESLNNNQDESFDRGVSFDGAGHTISNLTSSTGAYPSFVGVVKGAVKDVTFDKATITAGGATAGVLAGYVGSSGSEKTGNISGITVKNSSVTGKSPKRLGGIAGIVSLSSETITDCHVIATSVESESDKVGGLFGEVGEFTIDGCSAEDVTVTGAGTDGVGGLVGKLSGGTIQNCTTTGSVTGVTAVGGLVGRMNSGSLSNNSSAAVISNTTFYAGGLVGRMIAGTVTNCYATGNVTNTRNNYAHAGGFIGTIEGGSVEKCYATGNAESSAAYVGGLIGSINTTGTVTISKSYATGSVTNSTLRDAYLGGFLGCVVAGSPSVSNCYATGAVSGSYNTNNGFYDGGFVGRVCSGASLSVTNGYTTSSVVGGKWSACVFAGRVEGTVTCTGFVGWNTSSRVAWWYQYEQGKCPDGNYMGTEDSVYQQATTLGGWDFTNVWTTDATPKLR